MPLKPFVRLFTVLLTILAIFQLPKDVQDIPEAARPWWAVWEMVDQTTALWVALIGFGIWIAFADLGPVVRKMRGERYPDSHPNTCKELATVLGDVRYLVVSVPLYKTEDAAGQQIIMIEYKAAISQAVKLAAQVAYDDVTYNAVGDYLKRCNDLWLAELDEDEPRAVVLREDLAAATAPLMKALQSGQGVGRGLIPAPKGRRPHVGEPENAATV
jgi:hypothetical protein